MESHDCYNHPKAAVTLETDLRCSVNIYCNSTKTPRTMAPDSTCQIGSRQYTGESRNTTSISLSNTKQIEQWKSQSHCCQQTVISHFISSVALFHLKWQKLHFWNNILDCASPLTFVWNHWGECRHFKPFHWRSCRYQIAEKEKLT